MALPAVQLLCLEQGDRSLEKHTSDFLQLACLTHFPDRSLCIYYRTGLSERSKVRIPAGGPTEDFAAYVEWVLVKNNSQFTIGPAEDDTSSTPHPETNHPPSTTCTMEKREPTADRGDQPAGTNETEPEERTEGVVAPGCEPLGVSDQVREPATSCAVEGVLVEFEGWEESPDHNITAVDGIAMTTETFLDLLDVFEEVNSPCLVSPLVPSSSELFVSPAGPVQLRTLRVPAGSVQPCVPSQPPSPASSNHLLIISASNHLLIISASSGTLQPLISSISLRVQHSTAACRHVAFAVTPPSLGSTGNPQLQDSTRLPRPTGSDLVRRRPACTYGFIRAPAPPPQLDSIQRETAPTRRGAICYMYCDL
ncbi:hypothetical protein DPX16_21673 [Anabarilius grahami]|uniref:Uncharacterized protein n=1 Tax=Anabarilius grahami TaxID=495550 RepID=A0A3N0YJT5_ANAGA|nr:hypothetical protein DPX16_21673 [Anabarilius grahami]